MEPDKNIEKIVAEHLKPIYSFIYRLTGGHGDSADLTQEVNRARLSYFKTCAIIGALCLDSDKSQKSNRGKVSPKDRLTNSA